MATVAEMAEYFTRLVNEGHEDVEVYTLQVSTSCTDDCEEPSLSEVEEGLEGIISDIPLGTPVVYIYI